MADAAEQIFAALQERREQRRAALSAAEEDRSRTRCSRGVIGPGDALPSERDIAGKADVSRVTVRKAVQDLVKGGILVQRHGSGTFVAPRVERVEQSLSLLTSFTEDMARRGMAVRSEWLDRGIYRALARRDDGARPVVRTRWWRASAACASPTTRRWPSSAPRCRPSVLPDPAAVGASLYAALEKTGNRPVRAVQRISAANLGEADARLLDVPAGSAGLNIERISYLATGKVIEFTRSIYRGDTYDFVAELRLSGSGGAGRSSADDHADPYAARDRRDPGGGGAAARPARRRRLPRPGAAFASVDPAFLVTVARGSSDHAAAFLKYAVELTAGIAGRLARPVDRLDLWRQAEARAARPASPSRSRARARTSSRWRKAARDGGALTDRPHQHRRLAAGAGLATMPSTSWPARKAASPRPRPSSIRPSPGSRSSAQWTGDDGAACRARANCPAHFREAIDCDWMEIAGALADAEFAVHPRPRAVRGDRQRGGAEVQGDLRHACRGL